MTPSETVTAFIEAIERLDIDAAVAMLADDVSYENMPMSPIVGRRSVRATLEMFLGTASEVEWPVSSQFGDGNRVTNERVDRFKVGDGWLELPVAGFFEVDGDGLITLWRDYFDLASYTDQLAALTGGVDRLGLQPIVHVTEMERSINWYSTLLGKEASFSSEHWSTFSVGDGTLALHSVDQRSLVEGSAVEGSAEEPAGNGSVELSLVVDDTLEALLDRTGWDAAIDTQPFGRSLVLHDPDGARIQVNEHH